MSEKLYKTREMERNSFFTDPEKKNKADITNIQNYRIDCHYTDITKHVYKNATA